MLNVQPLKDAVLDISDAVRKINLAMTFGWQDVAQRYRRSRIGAFWLTINMAVLVVSIGSIFGSLFQSPMKQFLPSLTAGLIFWNFISTVISEGCTTFIQSEGIILQVRLPLFTHILRLWWRNTIILFHNFIIIPIVFIFYGYQPTFYWLISVVGLLMVSLNILWMAVVVSTICTRFRDMTQIVQNILQVVFYATPIIWLPNALPEGTAKEILGFNPFLHLVEVMRAPLMGTVPGYSDWVPLVALAVGGWSVALLLFGLCRRQIPYWL